MPLENVSDMMRKARREGYAVGYFESWNLESLQGVLDAAEATRSPIIVGFNGEFLSGENRSAPERLELYGALGRAAAESASVPCGLIFNECANDDWVRRAADCGFNLVMPADAAALPDDYRKRVRELCEYSHARGVEVEAELGALPCGASGEIEESGAMTSADEAARFVEETGVDLLAVSVGNVHIMLRGQRGLDLERLREISERVAVPLVLHGGTGIAPEALRAAISLGVCKVNYGTNLKQAYLKAVRAALREKDGDEDPHELLGIGGAPDVLVAGRRAVCDAMHERIASLNCAGKA